MQDLAKSQGTDEAGVETEFSDPFGCPHCSRFATADEVAAMVVYVCSLLASATNGAALR